MTSAPARSTLQVVDCRVDDAIRIRLHHTSLSLRAGELLAVIGPNGAGKSTLLKLMSGELAPSAGQVILDGRMISSWSPRALARRRAVLPQHSLLDFDFTGHEVVMLGRSPHAGCGREQDDAAVRHAMQRTDSTHLADRLDTTLSGGERQRVHLARVLAQLRSDARHPGYLMLDEPTAALDPTHQHGTLATVATLASEQGVGVMSVLHDLNLAALYADRVAVLRAGRLVAIGDPASVLTESLLLEVFELPLRVVEHPAHQQRPMIVAGRHEPLHSHPTRGTRSCSLP